MQIQSTQIRPNTRNLKAQAPEKPGTQQQSQEPQDGFTRSSTTSTFHRITGAASGALLGATAGVSLLTPMGDGMGADGLIFPLVGLVGGGLTGLVTGALVAGKVSSTEDSTSLFHRSTGVVAGAAACAVAGALLLSPAGNGAGAEGLIFPIAGFVGGALAGGVGGGIAAGRFPDNPN